MENIDVFDQQFPGTEEIDLSSFDEQFADADIPDREYDQIPDGKYQVVVDGVEIKRAKSSGNPMLAWTLRIIAPQFQGRLLWKNSVIASPENLKWLKADLYTCGLELQKISDLPNCLEKLLDVGLEIAIRTRGENQNIYFNKKIVLDESALRSGDDFPPELNAF